MSSIEESIDITDRNDPNEFGLNMAKKIMHRIWLMDVGETRTFDRISWMAKTMRHAHLGVVVRVRSLSPKPTRIQHGNTEPLSPSTPNKPNRTEPN